MDDGSSPWARLTNQWSQIQPFVPTYAHLIVSALFPIYAGAHASLTRPSSAAKPAKKDRRDRIRLRKERRKARRANRTRANGGESSSDDETSSEEEEEEEEHKMEGLAPTDALIMPLFAGITLAGLYFLIKWMKDPTLLNKLLNWYFALFGVFSVSRLITDVLNIGHSLIFPNRYTLGGALYLVNGKEKRALPVAGNTKDKHVILSPLPGFLAKIPLSNGLRKLLWNDRAMPGNKWTLRLYIHRIVAGKALIGPHGFVGGIIATMAVAYYNFVDKPWYLTNLMGFGLSYGALQIMSPTTFATGSLILGALFFYDIYFVFYTPMMVTVAKSLDVPIKLVFPRPPPADDPTAQSGHAMLGLGDVVLPGIMIGLALRFDLFLFYLRRQTRTKDLSGGEEDSVVEKPKYHSLAGKWSDHFWTHSLLTGRPLFKNADNDDEKEKEKSSSPFTFPKTYFKASLVGYIAGMLCTLAIMHVWGHAQPALLYLVPGVLASLWLTALARGELRLMWTFTEAAEEEEEEAQRQKKGETESSPSDSNRKEPKGKTATRESFFSLSDKKAGEREERARNALGKHVRFEDGGDSASDDEDGDGDKKEKEKEDKAKRNVKRAAGHQSKKEVFSFSIEAPWRLKSPRSVAKGEKVVLRDGLLVKEKDAEEGKEESGTVEPPVKRVRLN